MTHFVNYIILYFVKYNGIFCEIKIVYIIKYTRSQNITWYIISVQGFGHNLCVLLSLLYMITLSTAGYQRRVIIMCPSRRTTRRSRRGRQTAAIIRAS